MARFAEAYDYTYEFEKGLDNHPADPGGLTNDGLTMDDLNELGLTGGGDVDHDGDIDHEDLLKLSDAEKRYAYKLLYWDRLKLDQIENQTLAMKIFDAAVNLGLAGAGRIVQRACNAFAASLGIRYMPPLKVDGDIGPKTIARVNQLGRDELAGVIAAEQAGVYRLIVARRPESRVFLAGWLRRAYSQPGCAVNCAA
ncbi:hypothetical protein LLG95_11880 [bacterium]|nr:hypothetical protein [bacterium]